MYKRQVNWLRVRNSLHSMKKTEDRFSPSRIRQIKKGLKNGTDGLLPGMNVDAEIVISSAENVLAIPSGAINRGNTVLVTADSPSAVNALDQEAPEGYVYVEVETGVSDDSYTEVISGLQEGDTVAYLQTSGGGMAMEMMPMGGGQVMVGASPGGGMPSGGGMPGGGPMG